MQSNPYTNQSPFWDFAAGFERPGNNHPFLSRFYNAEGERGEGHRPNNDNFTPNPWAAWGDFYHGRPFPHRGPPPPPGAGPEHHDEENHETVPEKDNTNEKNDEMRDAPNDNGEGPSGGSGSDNEGRGGRGRHGRCGGRRRGHCGPGGFGGPWGHRGPHHHGPGRPHHGPGHHGPRGWGGRRGGWGGWGGPWSRGFNDPSEFLAQFWNPFNDTSNNNATEDHCPDADIFDTETAYVVHVSLPGAKKEDVGVNWDANKSELSVAGVIYRPGDEEFLKTLSVDERKVGAFERKIQLGTMASPAHVDVDGIVAKLEDGVLRVEVPKLDAGYVEVRKVDVE